MESLIELRLANAPLAASDARRALDPLRGRIATETLENLRLLVSELVTNSIRHAGGGDWIGLKVVASGGRIRVEVTDSGPGFRAVAGVPSLYQISGWGLYLVEQLSSRWGVDAGGRTCAWFEIDLGSQTMAS